MAKQELAQQRTEPESTWRALFLRVLSKREGPRLNTWWREESSQDDPYTSYAAYFLSALSLERPCVISTEDDLSTLGRLLSALRRASEEGIITDDEAMAVMKLMVSQFVERRVDCVLSDVLGDESKHRRTLQRIAGSLKHGRACKSSR
jgi:hypothetical protein